MGCWDMLDIWNKNELPRTESRKKTCNLECMRGNIFRLAIYILAGCPSLRPAHGTNPMLLDSVGTYVPGTGPEQLGGNETTLPHEKEEST